MQIRQKLTYQFILIVALILTMSSLSIYFFSDDYRRDNFYNRLLNKATNTAKLLIEVEEVDAELLKRIDKDNPVSLPYEIITIYNHKDELLYGSNDDELLWIDSEILNRIRIEGEVRYWQGNYEVLGFMFADNFNRFTVVAGAIDINGLNKLKNLRAVLLIVFGISILLVFVSGSIYAGRALKPISKVIEQVNNISISSLNMRVDEGNSKDEIALLAATFNKMLSRLEASFKIQKNFIANASHELRTPLTAITGQLEVALIRKRSNDEYEQIIASVLEDMKSLNSISNRLLLLAQTSAETPNVDFKPFRIDDLIWQVRTELIKMNSHYVVEIEIGEDFDDENQFIIFGNEHLVKTAISNLMDNGCKYTSDYKIRVSIQLKEQNIFLHFIDQGIGIDPKDTEYIFEPFRRGKNVSSIKGHGIGLSLVQRIAMLHNGNVRVESVLDGGSTFTISFPIYKI